MTTTPSLRRTMPQKATATPTSCSLAKGVAAEIAEAAREARQVGNRDFGRYPAARPFDARRAQDRTTQADDRGGQIVDCYFEGQHDGAISAQADERRRPTGHTEQLPARFLDKPDCGQFTDEHPNGTARQPCASTELRTRQPIDMQGAHDRAQVCATDGFASQTQFEAALIQAVCIPLCQTIV